MKKTDTDFKSMFKDFENTSSILKKIAESFPAKSPEAKAIKASAHAFLFLQSHNALKKSFNYYMAKVGKPLSKFHRMTLRDMGIDPNKKNNVVINKK